MADKDLKDRLEGFFSELPDQIAADATPTEDLDGIEEMTLALEEETTGSADLLASLERRALHLQTAAQVSHAVSSILNLDELLPQVVNLIRESFDFYYAGIFLVDEPGEWAVLQAGAGEAGRQMMEQGHRLQVGGDSMIGRCVANKQARIALDVGEEAARFDNPLLPQTRSEMALPLISRGYAIGAMTIQSASPAAFTKDDITVLQTMADQVASAIQNARLFQGRERRVTELGIVNEIGRTVSSALGLDELLETVHQQVSIIFDTTNFYIASYQEGSDEWTATFQVERGQRQPPARYKVGAGFTGHIIRTRQSVLLRSVEENLAFKKAQGIEFIGELSRSWLGVPLMAGDKVVGVMAIQNYEQENLYGQQDLALFTTIADQVATAFENLRLLEESRHRARELEVINEVGRVITSVLDLDTLLRQIVDITKSRFGQYVVSISLIEGDQIASRGGSAIGNSDRRLEIGQVVIDLLHGPSLVAEATRTRQPILVNDVLEEPRYLPVADLPDTRSELAVPIEVKDRVIGVLDMQSDQPFAYSQADVTLLQSLASQIGVAIENARLFQEHGRRIAELDIINEAGQALSSALALDEVLEIVHQQIGRIFDTTDFYIATYEEGNDEWALVLELEHGQRQPRTRHQVGSGMTGYIIRTRQPVLLCTQQECIAFDKEQGIELIGQQSKSWMGVPLIAAGKTVGVMAIQSYEQEHLYDERALALFSTIAARTAAAIENIRLLEETRLHLEQFSALYEIGQEIATTLDLDALLQTIVDDAARLTGGNQTLIALLDADQREVLQLVGHNYSAEHLQSITFDELWDGLTGWVLREKEPTLTRDMLADGRETGVARERSRQVSTRSVAVAPLMVKGQAIGTLTGVNPRDRPVFTLEDLNLLVLLANQAANAIENTRLFQEHERRIAELDIINEAGQALSSALALDEVLEIVHQQIGRIFDTTDFYIATYEEGNDEWALVLELEHGQRQPRTRHQVGSGITGYIIRARQPVLLRTQQEGIAFDKEQGIELMGQQSKSWMGVPLIAAGKTVGVMAIQSYEQEHLYDERDLALFSTIAARTAAAIENIHLLEETRLHLEQFSALYEIGQEIATTLDLDTLLQTIVDDAARLTGGNQALIALLDTDRREILQLVGHNYSAEHLQGITFEEFWDGLTGWVLREKEPVLTRDTSADERETGLARKRSLRVSTGSVAVAPLMIKGQVIGTLTSVNPRGGSVFTPEDLNLLVLLASQAANAIENTRLFQETNIRAEELAVLNELSQALAATLDVEEVLNKIYQGVSRLLDTTNFYIGLYDPRKNEISFPVDTAESEIDREITVMSADEDITGYIIHNRESVLIEKDVSAWLEERGIAWVGQEATSWLGAPLMIGEQVLGVMSLQSYTTSQRYNERDRDLLTAIASQASIAIQNARLFKETNVRAGELAVLNELSQALAATLDVEEVLNDIYRGVSRLLDTTNFYIGLYDPHKNEISFPIDTTESELDREITVMSADEGLTGYIIHNRESVLIEKDVSAWLEERGIERVGQEAASWLGVPLMIGEQVLGVMSIQSYTTSQRYNERDRDLLTAIASQASIAIQNARLFKETNVRAEELTVLNELGQALTVTLDVDQVMEAAYRGASRLMDTANFFVALYDPDKEEINFALDTSESALDAQITTLPASQGVTGYIIRNRANVLIQDNMADRLAEMGVEQVGEPVLSWIGVPLVIGDRVLGAVGAQSYTAPYTWDEHDLYLLTSIASQTAIALQNAYLFEEAQTRAGSEQALRRIVTAIGASKDLVADLPALTQHLRELAPVDVLTLALYTPGDLDYTLFTTGAASHSPSTLPSVAGQRAQPGIRLPVKGTAPGWVITHQEFRLDEDIRAEKLFAEDEQLIAQGLVSRLILPLPVGDQVIGALNLINQQAGAFTPEHLPALRRVVSQMALTLERARLLEETQAALSEVESAHRRYLRQAWEGFLSRAPRAWGYLDSPTRLVNTEEVWTPEIEQAVATGTTVAWEAKGGEPRAALALPIRLGGQTIGVLDFYDEREGRVWTEDEKSLVEALADQVALALDNARLFEQTERRAYREQLTAELSGKIHGAGDVRSILATAAEGLGRALGVSRALIRLESPSDHAESATSEFSAGSEP